MDHSSRLSIDSVILLMKITMQREIQYGTS